MAGQPVQQWELRLCPPLRSAACPPRDGQRQFRRRHLGGTLGELAWTNDEKIEADESAGDRQVVRGRPALSRTEALAGATRPLSAGPLHRRGSATPNSKLR